MKIKRKSEMKQIYLDHHMIRQLYSFSIRTHQLPSGQFFLQDTVINNIKAQFHLSSEGVAEVLLCLSGHL